MDKRKNGFTEDNQQMVLFGLIALVVLAASGILSVIFELVVGLIVGVFGLVVGLTVGAIGLVIGLVAAAFALTVGLFGAAIGVFFGTAFIWGPILLAVVVIRARSKRGIVTEKRKNDVSYV